MSLTRVVLEHRRKLDADVPHIEAWGGGWRCATIAVAGWGYTKLNAWMVWQANRRYALGLRACRV